MKCGAAARRLEAHHVVPVVFGGTDATSNLVTLCSSCHEAAPNEPADFFRWAASGLPPTMDLSKNLSMICISVLLHREGLGEKMQEYEALVDEIYPDLWKIFKPAGTGTTWEDKSNALAEGVKEIRGKYFGDHLTDQPAGATTDVQPSNTALEPTARKTRRG